MLYNLELNNDVLTVGFGEPASNDAIVKEVAQSIKWIKDEVHGKVLKINGPASMPIAFVLAHELAHVTAGVAVYDPKLNGYVVVISHGGPYKIGEVIINELSQ